MVARLRFELRTLWLKVKCSTYWANEPNSIMFSFTLEKINGCLGRIRTGGMSESKSDALPLGYEALFKMVGRHRFELWNTKEQIYSLPRLTTSLSPQKKWCRQRESNSQPTDYKSVALPVTLCRQIHGGRYRTRTYDPLLVRQLL